MGEMPHIHPKVSRHPMTSETRPRKTTFIESKISPFQQPNDTDKIYGKKYLRIKKKSYAKFMLNGLAGKGENPCRRTTRCKNGETKLPQLISQLSSKIPSKSKKTRSSALRSYDLSLVATKAIAVALSSGSAPLRIWGWLTTSVSTSTSRTSVCHLWVGVLTWRLSWRTAITTLLTRELAWRLLVSHRSG